jgi:acetoin utilization protein AcuB
MKSALEQPLKLMKMREAMTLSPLTVDEDSQLTKAVHLMREKKIRHLPVVHDGKLRGILSERDTRAVALLPDLEKFSVSDVMTRKPSVVGEHILVLDAVLKMAEKKIGCLVVTGESESVVGIFTTQDALYLLLRERGHQIPASTAWLEDDDGDIDPGDCIG